MELIMKIMRAKKAITLAYMIQYGRRCYWLDNFLATNNRFLNRPDKQSSKMLKRFVEGYSDEELSKCLTKIERIRDKRDSLEIEKNKINGLPDDRIFPLKEEEYDSFVVELVNRKNISFRNCKVTNIGFFNPYILYGKRWGYFKPPIKSRRVAITCKAPFSRYKGFEKQEKVKMYFTDGNGTYFYSRKTTRKIRKNI